MSEEEFVVPPPFRGEVVFGHIGEDIGETSRANQLPTYSPSAISSNDMYSIKLESLSHARPIPTDEFTKLLNAVNATEFVPCHFSRHAIINTINFL